MDEVRDDEGRWPESTSNVSDSMIREATGRSRAEWYELLDETGADTWDHTTIARWLGGKHDVDSWWAQGVTSGYVQSRGLQSPGHSADGHFDATASKTFTVPTDDVWPFLEEDDARRNWLDLELTTRGKGLQSIRFDGGEGTRVAFHLTSHPPTASGRQRCTLTITHTRLTRDAVKETETFWQDALDRLAALFTA